MQTSQTLHPSQAIVHGTTLEPFPLTPTLLLEIDRILESYAMDPTRLVDMLLEIQDFVPRQYLPKAVAVYVGEKLDLPLSRVYDVISFYEALSDVPRADIVIQFCDSVVCRVSGNHGLKQSLESLLGIRMGETTEDGKFHLQSAPCFGACDISPAIRVNGVVYGPLKSQDALKALLETWKKGGESHD